VTAFNRHPLSGAGDAVRAAAPRHRILAAVLLACFLAGCAAQGDGAFRAVADQTAPIAPPADPTAGAGGGDYRIVPGDILQIAVFQVPDLSRDAQVDAAGNIVMPLLGGVVASARTARDVEAEIASRLKAKYLQNPQVSVTVKDAVALRVTVQGAVRNPGVIPLRGAVTLTNVIAQAQGFGELADKSDVLIIRNTEQGRVAAKVDVGAVLPGAAADPAVRGGDIVVVNDSLARSVFKDAMTIVSGGAAVKFLAQ
jgi:polysaccharide export outer membrane protein